VDRPSQLVPLSVTTDRTATVSVVIPVYNGANYLRQAIDSALGQTHPHTEVIVVNDGSTDCGRTRDIAASYGRRIRYFEKTNGGVATALNLGLREMRGQFFSWLSHDDVYYPKKIERQVAYWHQLADDRVILFSGSHIIDDRSRVTGTGPIHGLALRNSILAVLGTYVGGCSTLIPKAAFDEAGWFNEDLRNSQDIEMWLRMVMKGYRFQCMPEVLIQSRSHAEQATRTDSARHVAEVRAFYLWALQAIGARHRIENAPALFRILFMKRFTDVAPELFSQLRKDRSFLYAAAALSLGGVELVSAALARRVAGVTGRGAGAAAAE
jgi:glycosyltransferase involved in cell wall biosynthesis